MSRHQHEMEFESMGEFEDEDEMEGEFEEEMEGEDLPGLIAGGLLGGRREFEDEDEGEWEFEGLYEDEAFLDKIAGFVRQAAPVLRNVAKVAAPMVGSAVGTMFGPAGTVIGGQLGKLTQRALSEGEFEGEFEDEWEWEGTLEAAPLTAQQIQAELMAAVAARAQSPIEAEAMAGAATVTALSPADRQALHGMLPHLVSGTAVLTRILRQNPATRPAVRAIPTIVQRTGNMLARQAEAGQPVTLRTTARVMANQTRQVLSNPRTCATALQRNVRATRAAASGAARQRQRPANRRPANRRRRPISG